MENIATTISNLFDMLMSQIMPVIQPLIPTEISEAFSNFITAIAPLWNQVIGSLSDLIL